MNAQSNLQGYFEGYQTELMVSTNSKPVKPAAFDSDILFSISLNISDLRNLVSPKQGPSQGSALGAAQLAGIYFAHGLWNFESNIHNFTQDQTALISPVSNWMSRIFSTDPIERGPRVGKGSLALPGMLWITNHNYGITGGAVALALLTVIGNLALFNAKAQIFGLMVLLFTGVFLIISPVASAAALLWFPFGSTALIIYVLVRYLLPRVRRP